MTRQMALMLLLSSGLTIAVFAHTQEPLPPPPSVIGSTYVVNVSNTETHTIHLYEDNGQLVMDEKWANGNTDSRSVKYEKVNYVEVQPDSLRADARKRNVIIEDAEGRYIIVTLPGEMEAYELAQYVVTKASVPLELIAGAWRVRKSFDCPDAGQPGCKDFKELLDHDDPDIAGYFYTRDNNTHVYACFSAEDTNFFVAEYSHVGKYGTFSLAAFRSGQSDRTDFGQIDWPLGDTGKITNAPRKQGEKPQTLGWIDSSSLSYRTSFTNRLDTTTLYELNIRWSTARYTEAFSGKDDKGKRFRNELSGICVKLH